MSLTLMWLVWGWPFSGGGSGLEGSVVPEAGEDRYLQGWKDRVVVIIYIRWQLYASFDNKLSSNKLEDCLKANLRYLI